MGIRRLRELRMREWVVAYNPFTTINFLDLNFLIFKFSHLLILQFSHSANFRFQISHFLFQPSAFILDTSLTFPIDVQLEHIWSGIMTYGIKVLALF